MTTAVSTLKFTLNREQIDKYLVACQKAAKAITSTAAATERCVLLKTSPASDSESMGVDIWSLNSTSHSVHLFVHTGEVSLGHVLIEGKRLLEMNTALKGKEQVTVYVENSQLVYDVQLLSGTAQLREDIYFQQDDFTVSSPLCNNQLVYSPVAEDNGYLSDILARMGSPKGCLSFKSAILDCNEEGEVSLFGQFSDSGWINYKFPTGLYIAKGIKVPLMLESIASFGFKGDNGLNLAYNSSLKPNGALRFSQGSPVGQDIHMGIVPDSSQANYQRAYNVLTANPAILSVKLSARELFEALNFQAYGLSLERGQSYLTIRMMGEDGGLVLSSNSEKTRSITLEPLEYLKPAKVDALPPISFDLTSLMSGLALMGNAGDAGLLSLSYLIFEVAETATSTKTMRFARFSSPDDNEWVSNLIQFERSVHS